MFDSRCVKWMPHPDSFEFHQRPVMAPGSVGAGAEARLAVHCIAPGTEIAVWYTLLESIVDALEPYPTYIVAPATLGVGTLFRISTACDCEPSTPVRYASMVDEETATSCPLELTCASTHTIASPLVAAGVVGDDGARLAGEAPVTRLEGACAKTNRLAFVPTSCVGACTVAPTSVVVAEYEPFTVMEKTGEDAGKLAVKVPVTGRGCPASLVALTTIVPDVPFQVAV